MQAKGLCTSLSTGSRTAVVWSQRRSTALARPVRLPLLRVAAEAAPHHNEPGSGGGSRQQHNAPPGAYPDRRASRVSSLRNPVLRTLAVPRPQPLNRYTGSSEAAVVDAGSAARPGPGTQQQSAAAAAAPAEETPLSRDALVLILLATAVSFICSIDRAAMSVAILPMSQQFDWDDGIKGSVSSAFFVGYMVTNLCGGFLATKYSAKGVLALGVVLWSMFTIATPTAAAGNLQELMLARAMMGVGEGVTYPSLQNMARKWVPEEKRSRALAFIYSGHQLGTIGSYVLCPLLIAHLGWESVFWIFGSLGFVWMLGWVPLVRDDTVTGNAFVDKLLRGPQPPTATATPALASASAAATAAAAAPVAEASSAAAAGVDGTNPQLRLQDVPWAEFAKNKAFWAIVAAQCTVSVGNVLAFSWLPTFYNQVYGVDIAASSFYSVLPFVVTVLATNAGGWIADGLVNNQVLDKTNTRKLMQAIASLGPAVCLVKLAADQGQGSSASLMDAVALVTAWISLCGFSAAGYGSNHQDISKKYSGILYGLSNGMASVAASVSIYATGQVLHYTHDWSLVFEASAGLYAVGALAYLGWASCEEQFNVGDEAEKKGGKAGKAATKGPSLPTRPLSSTGAKAK